MGSSKSDGVAELELGLCLGGARKFHGGVKSEKHAECCRILTAEDFPTLISCASPISSSSSSSGSSSPVGGPRASCNSPTGQVVGWPPIRAYRMNNLVNHFKDGNVSGEADTCNGTISNTRSKEVANQEAKRVPGGNSFLVKVNKDGDPIGRKIGLSSIQSYEALALTLEKMFTDQTSDIINPKGIIASKLLDGSSEFSLTYMDKDGDWMLVGDVPWGMFVTAVKRLRIMRTADTNGFSSPRLQPS